MTLGPRALVAWQQQGPATLLRSGLEAMLRPAPSTTVLSSSVVAPAALSRLQSLSGCMQGLGAAEVPSAPALGGRAGLPWDNVPPMPGWQKQGKTQILYCTYIF